MEIQQQAAKLTRGENSFRHCYLLSTVCVFVRPRVRLRRVAGRRTRAHLVGGGRRAHDEEPQNCLSGSNQSSHECTGRAKPPFSLIFFVVVPPPCVD